MNLTDLIQTNFSNDQLIWILLAFLVGLISIILFVQKKILPSLVLLFVSGLILRFIAAGLDPFLNTWDEQFHALVARNMMDYPFKPQLHTHPVLDFDYRDWTSNHVWLHKQPWFLWQIALSMKLFGISEFGLRLPTVVMFSFMILLIFRIGQLLVNKKTAWYAAFLYTFSFYFTSFVSGNHFTDHNDAAFIFYVTLSFWSWLEFRRSGKWKWVILTGLFAGIAILNKWLIGMTVYLAWLTTLMFQKSFWADKKELISFATAFFVTALVVLPWQIYILNAFPEESQYEFSLNTQHFFKAVENHDGNFYYHFWLLSYQYGGFFVLFILLPGLYYFFSGIRDYSLRYSILFMMVFVYLFFTLAATKMPMFCTIVSPLIFLGIGAALEKGVKWIKERTKKKIFPCLLVLLLFYLAYFNLEINRIDGDHSVKQSHWGIRRLDAMVDKYVAARIAKDDDVVFNCGGYNAIMFMFYSGKTAYGNYPDLEQYQKLKEKGIPMAVFVDSRYPDYLARDKTIKKLFPALIPF